MKTLLHIVTVLKGMVIGGTMLVPGVSGGSMAMILGIYDRLVSSVSSFFKHKRESLLFLLLFSAGGLLGAALFATPLLHLIEAYPMPVLYFFLGAVAGSVPMIFRQAEIKRFSFRALFYILAGILAVLLLSLIPVGTFQSQMQTSFSSILLLAAAGFIAAVALVLPGISVSYLLLVMGLYDETMRAIGDFYMPFLLPLGIGLLLGIILTTKILEKAMERYTQPTYMIILGFVLGSVVELFPGIPQGGELLLSICTLFAGFGAIMLISSPKLKDFILSLSQKDK